MGGFTIMFEGKWVGLLLFEGGWVHFLLCIRVGGGFSIMLERRLVISYYV